MANAKRLRKRARKAEAERLAFAAIPTASEFAIGVAFQQAVAHSVHHCVDLVAAFLRDPDAWLGATFAAHVRGFR